MNSNQVNIETAIRHYRRFLISNKRNIPDEIDIDRAVSHYTYTLKKNNEYRKRNLGKMNEKANVFYKEKIKTDVDKYQKILAKNRESYHRRKQKELESKNQQE